jgi:hypothetical protein
MKNELPYDEYDDWPMYAGRFAESLYPQNFASDLALISERTNHPTG